MSTIWLNQCWPVTFQKGQSDRVDNHTIDVTILTRFGLLVCGINLKYTGWFINTILDKYYLCFPILQTNGEKPVTLLMSLWMFSEIYCRHFELMSDTRLLKQVLYYTLQIVYSNWKQLKFKMFPNWYINGQNTNFDS